MLIWIDTDVCPRQFMDKIYRLTLAREIQVKVICNSLITLPPIDTVERIVVGNIQKYILENAEFGDTVICLDLTLILALIEKGVVVISTLGDLFTPENIKEQMSVNLKEEYSNPRVKRKYTLKEQETFLITFNKFLNFL